MKSIEWLAGLLEGEGCFSSQQSGSSGLYTTPLISLVMTDGDVVEEAAALFFVVGGRVSKINKRALASGKTAFVAYITGLPAVKIMRAVLPYMGERRSCKIKRIIREWAPIKYKEAKALKEAIQGEY